MKIDVTLKWAISMIVGAQREVLIKKIYMDM